MTDFVPACAADAIPAGEGRNAVVAGVRVAIFNTAEGWRCVQAECTHRAGPLADGIVADASVTCPLHLRRFDLASGDAIGHDCPGLAAHEVQERDGQLLVRLAEARAASLAA